MDIQLNTIAEAIEDIKAGKIIIVVDDEDRENEGDFVAAAETITNDQVNFMLSQGRGLLCAPLTAERCRKLGLELMVTNNTALHETPFTVSVDLLGHGCTTGISIHDRTQTIKALVDPTTDPSSLGRPGHIFPLRAVDKGVLVRPGHTEAVVDLTRLAGLTPGGVLIEILNADGTMARLPELMEIAREHNMKVVSIKDLVEYRLSHDNIVERGERVKMPTAYGTFEMIPYREKNGLEHFAIVKGNWNANDSVLIRVHSSCVTGDILGSCRCDCGDQLHQAMRMIEQEGVGAIVYLNQEGRGIGLMNKLHAYKLQEEGQDTVEANISLGFGADERDYGVGASIIRDLGITKMRLMSNNPSKRHGLEVYGLNIVENVSIIAPTNPFNLTYLKTKEDKMGHELMMKK